MVVTADVVALACVRMLQRPGSGIVWPPEACTSKAQLDPSGSTARVSVAPLAEMPVYS